MINNKSYVSIENVEEKRLNRFHSANSIGTRSEAYLEPINRFRNNRIIRDMSNERIGINGRSTSNLKRSGSKHRPNSR